jgi:WhiB family redox-sensing transcriptional regulator
MGYRSLVNRKYPTAAPLPVGLRPTRSRASAISTMERARRRWRSPTWAAQAACAGQTDLFFGAPTETDRARLDRERLALAVCADCPVLVPCREHARQFREAGIWGGESEYQRRAALRRLKIEPVTIEPASQQIVERLANEA